MVGVRLCLGPVRLHIYTLLLTTSTLPTASGKHLDGFFWSTHRKSLDGDMWKWGQEGLLSGSPFWKQHAASMFVERTAE